MYSSFKGLFIYFCLFTFHLVYFLMIKFEFELDLTSPATVKVM